MKTTKWIARTIMYWVIFLFCHTSVWSQAFFSTSKINDVSAQSNYDKIKRHNNTMSKKAVLNKGAVLGIGKVITTEFTDLTTAPIVSRHKRTVKNFIRRTSLEFIREKYPKLQAPPSTNEIFKNTLIQARFTVKLLREAQKTENYFKLNNPISEGERLLLALSSIEKVLKICLENETYH